MSIVDILIVIFIVVGGFVGFKDGFTKSLVKFFGFSAVVLLSYLLKDTVSSIYMTTLPFFPFAGAIKGLTVLNIALYEFLAFISLFTIFMVILKIVSRTTGIFERFLSLTILFGIPSKILGSILGLIKNYIIAFFVIYYLSMPNFYDLSPLKNSKLKEPILKYTPVLSMSADNMMKVASEFGELEKKYENTDSINKFNLDTLDLFLKYKVTTPSNVKKLSDSGKIKIDGLDQLLERYE